jgi:diaminopimelate epimerase
MEVDFVKISPTQNMTILITSPVTRQQQPAVAQKVMAYDNVYAEQVGFVEKPDNPKAAARLQMAGGEFCGNATLSLCAYLVWKGDIECNDRCTVPVEASGASEILYCDITKKAGYFLAKIGMPVPERIENFNVKIEGTSHSLPVVYMPGISHVIVDMEKTNINKDLLVEKLILDTVSFTREEAFGIMFYDKNNCSIEPFVCVKTSDTKVWERGCGSGSGALGAYLAQTSGKSIKAEVSQPGGIITVEADMTDGKITNLSIEGKIVICAYGKAQIII